MGAGDAASVSEVIRPSFERLVSSLYSAVLYNLGQLKLRGVPDVPLNEELARFNLGLLEILRDKTRGNLTDEEQMLIDGTIDNARRAIDRYAAGAADAASS